jgi:Putative porin
MRAFSSFFLLLLGALISGYPLPAAAAESFNTKLLDTLVRKGVLTHREGAEIRQGLAEQATTGPTGRLDLARHVQRLTLYGSVRWRYQWNGATTQPPVNPPGPFAGASPQQSAAQSRARYKFQIGATYALTDDMQAGLEFASAPVNDSLNQTIGNGYGKFNAFVSLLYLEWHAADWLTLTGGKQLNPLYSTSLVWDSDLHPEGVTEQMTWHLSEALTVGFVAGQWVYVDDNTNTIPDAVGNTLPFNAQDSIAWQFVQQVPIRYAFLDHSSKGTTEHGHVLVAPGFMTSTTGLTDQTVTSMPGFLDGTTSFLNIVTAPGEIGWQSHGLPIKFYWDFAWNVTGHQRVREVYLNGAPAAFREQHLDLDDNIAYLAGLQVGQNKKKGDWMVMLDFRSNGIGAIDPNLSDSDFGSGQLNQRGFRLEADYSFTDFLVGSVTYFNTWNIAQDFYFPPGSAGAGAAPNNLVGANGTQIVQVDLKWQF